LTDFDGLSYPTMAPDQRGNLVVASTTAFEMPEAGRTVLRKFTTKGKVLWEKSFDFGEVFYIGQFNDGGLLLPTRDGLLVKLDENGNGVWTNRFSDGVGGVAIDPLDGVFVTSRADNPLEEMGKFDSRGALVWSNQVRLAWFASMATDAEGSAYFFSEAQLVKVNYEGVFQWTNSLQSSSLSMSPTDIAVDSRGDIHVTGWEDFSQPPECKIVWVKITPDGRLSSIKSQTFFSGTTEYLIERAHFLRVRPSGVTIGQYHGDLDADGYEFIPYTLRWQGNKTLIGRQ
jgi:hypothetical protein